MLDPEISPVSGVLEHIVEFFAGTPVKAILTWAITISLIGIVLSTC